MQNEKDLEDFYQRKDPWDYDTHPHDAMRRKILLNEIETLEREPITVLDIGCGNGFITNSLPGQEIIGVDISEEAIRQANERKTNEHVHFFKSSLFDISNLVENNHFDLIIITGVLYEQYIGNSTSLIYLLMNSLLKNDGILMSVHIRDWYYSRFPFFLCKTFNYKYREFEHCFEVYVK